MMNKEDKNKSFSNFYTTINGNNIDRGTLHLDCDDTDLVSSIRARLWWINHGYCVSQYQTDDIIKKCNKQILKFINDSLACKATGDIYDYIGHRPNEEELQKMNIFTKNTVELSNCKKHKDTYITWKDVHYNAIKNKDGFIGETPDDARIKFIL